MAYCIAIETSCDETSLAVLEFDSKELKSDHDFHKRINSIQLLVSLVSSQIEVHKLYGGVVPEIGAREHSKLIYPLFTELVRQFEEKTERSKTDLYKDLQMVAVTTRPGLDSALRVGEECAKSLQFFIAQKSGNTDIQIQRVNHLHGHVMSSFYATPFESKLELVSDKELFPHLHVLVSGGNTQFFNMKSPEDYQIIGQTLDDAVGESLDKIGRMLGLPYPGGVAISRIVGLEHGNPLNLPIPMKGDPSFNVSNSGLKTAVRYLVQQQNFDHWSFEDRLSDGDAEILLKYKEKIEKNPHLEFIYQVAVSAHTVVLEQVLNTSRKILKKHQFASIGLSGGVSANPFLRKGMQDLGYPTFLPDRSLTGDNAVMIGLSGLMDNGGW